MLCTFLSFPRLRSSRLPALFFALFAALALAGCGSGPQATSSLPKGSEVTLEGDVHGGQQPIVGATIQLYAAGTGADKSPATPLIASAPLTGAGGAFSITGLYTCPSITAEVYLVASGGNPGLGLGDNPNSVLISALGPCGNLTSATHIVINEVSTIGSIYPLTQYMGSYLNIGSSAANFNTFASDFMLINQYINTDGGQSPGPALPGGFSAPVANLYTLANSMSACVNSAGGVAGDGTTCGNFFQYATPPAGTPPTNTADAILNIANNPTQNVNNIFLLSATFPAFQPTLSSAPADWTLKILPSITLTTPSNLVGVGSTNTGTITLGQAPATALTISLASSNTAAVSVVSPVTIAAGATTGTFSYTGVASGTGILTATADGYASSSVILSATASLISLGAIPNVAPGQSVDLPLSLGTAAPAGGVNISFASADTSVATISPSVVNIPAGLKVPAANPRVTGVAIGTTQINATGTGYAPGSQSVSVGSTSGLPATATIPIGTPTNVTITISAPAPVGGITFSLTSDNTGIFTTPASVTIVQGATTATIALTGVASGTSTLHATSTGATASSSSITVNGTINLQATTLTTGAKLQSSTYFYFAAVPPSPVTATITSNSPGVVLVSNNATTAGAATTTITGITNTNASTFYLQGVAPGSGTVTISAPGYAPSTLTVTVNPSGFVIYQPASISTTTLSSDTSVTILPAVLNGAGTTVLGYAAVAPGPSVSIAVASSNTGVGTIPDAPAVFTANVSSVAVNFHPLGEGTTNVSISTPAGFTTAPANTTIAATVTAAPISVQTPTITTGTYLEASTYAYLSQAPKVATTVTITSNNPAVALVSTSSTVAGTTSTTVPAVVNTNAFTYYIHGVSVGSTTLTISASPYSSATVTVTVDPSGFVIYQPGSITTTSLSSATSISIFPAVLNPGSLSVLAYGTVSPLAGTVNVPISSSNTAAGTLSPAPVVFHGGDSSQATSFQPVGAGTSNISLGLPSGFTTPTPATTQQITATVTAPPIGLQTTTLTTGAGLEVSTYAYLSQTPTTPITITVSSDKPAVATVSSGVTTAGAATTTFPNTVNTNAKTFYIQGQMVGTATLTISAPGYQSATIAVTVDPSGFVIYQPGNFSTTTFSSPTSLTIFPAILKPSDLTVIGYAALNPGSGTTSLTLNSSATQVGTITSPITFQGGDSSKTSAFQPVAAGNTNISISTPSGFSVPTPAATQQITATVTAPPIGLQSGSLTTGANLEISTYAYLSQAPPSGVTLSATSNNTSIATISTSATIAGSDTITFPALTNTNAKTFYIQGHSTGTTTITLSAAGYSNATITVTVDPSGFVIYQPGNFSTTTFSAPTALTIFPTILSPGTFTVVGYAALNPGIGSVSVPVSSSNTSTGTVTTPIIFNGGDSSLTSNFQPVGAGTTNLSIGTPSGFTTPSNAATQQITAIVTAPPIGVQSTSITTGSNLEVSTYTYLSQTPPSAVTLTATVSDPTIATLSTSAVAVGGNSVTFPGTANTNAKTFYIQGHNTGSTTITLSAPGYANATIAVTVDPSGFVIYQPGNFSTTTFSSTTTITVLPTILTPGTLTVVGYGSINPGIGSISVPIGSSNTAIGTVTSPIVFNAGDSSSTSNFQPSNAGSTTLTISIPSGFSTPSQNVTQQITATVTAPPIGLQTANLTIGNSLQSSTYTYLGVSPPSAVNITLTSNNPAIATLATTATSVGTSSITFSGAANTNALTFYVQGQSVGTTTITLTAPGYATSTINVTVDPSGFVIYQPGNFTTSAGANATTITVLPAVLNPGVLTVLGYGTLNPGIGTVTVPVGSTSPQIGTVSPTGLAFTAGTSSETTAFTPLTSGSTDIVIVNQPAGFTTPSQPVTQQITATVQ